MLSSSNFYLRSNGEENHTGLIIERVVIIRPFSQLLQMIPTYCVLTEVTRKEVCERKGEKVVDIGIF